MAAYRKRIYDNLLAWRLQTKGAVLIVGPKWCGKTTTAARLAESALYLQDPASRSQNLRLAQISPQSLLEGPVPRLLDEWQEAPELWDAVRFEVDRRGVPGQFILTGSTVPPEKSMMRHSGTGRVARVRMGTMSLSESGESTGEVSLGSLFEGKALPVVRCEGDLSDMAFLVCRGGWPAAIGMAKEAALQQAIDYLDAVAASDISRYDGVRRSETSTRALLRSYARMVSSQGSYASMMKDTEGSERPLGETAFASYVEALRGLFVIEDLSAWSPNLRSKTAIRTTPTRHFADPSIAAAALGASPADLMADLNTFGLLFESLCVRDLRAYLQALGGEVAHYRDKSGLEADAVLRLRDGRYALVEAKLGGESAIEDGAKTLKELASRMDPVRTGAPSFLMVLTAVGEFSYPREDGVLVVPIRTLGA